MMRLLQVLPLLALFAFVASTALFLSQGGFGGGHGRFDKVIVILGLPWVLIPWPDVFLRSDYLSFIFLPLVMNLGFVGLLLLVLRCAHRAG